MKVSIKAKPIKVALNKVSTSSGFLDTDILQQENKILVPKTPKAIGNMHPPKTKVLIAAINNKI